MDFCTQCGSQIDENAVFCTNCGTKSKLPDLSPLGFIKSSLRSSSAAVKSMLKNPKQMIPMLAMSAVWLILSLLPAFGINPVPVQILSFLSFAQGGMYGGPLGAVGGIVGKALFAYFITALILPLFSGKKPFKGTGTGFKRFFTGLAVQSIHSLALLLTGFGFALILFNFLTGNASLVNSMAGVTGFLIALKGLGSKSGFIWGLLLSITNKFSNGKVSSPVTVSRIITGFAAGNAASIALSALSIPYLLYAVGILLIIAGVIAAVIVKPDKEAAAI